MVNVDGLDRYSEGVCCQNRLALLLTSSGHPFDETDLILPTGLSLRLLYHFSWLLIKSFFGQGLTVASTQEAYTKSFDVPDAESHESIEV